jgi:osmoprotectant transport system permease protein
VNDALRAAAALLPEYLGAHVVLSAASLALGLAASSLLTLAAVRSARVRWPVLTIASIIQTIPSLALLALFYPLLLALSAVCQWAFGVGFSALGFLPSLLALALYSMLPVIRNGVTGILNLDPAVIEAARGVGMTPSQQLWRVELPLAAPMLMAGVRTAAVWIIGGATLATPVGQTSLGNYIFAGLQTQNWIFVLVGCAAAALLALGVDQLLGLIQSGVERRRPGRIVAGAAVLVVGVAAAALPLGRGAAGSYVIGAKNFSEQFILAALLADRITAEGGQATRREGLGSAVAFEALAAGDIDAYVDYSGTLWANVMRRADHPPRAQLLAETRDWLMREHGVVLLGSLGFENAYALAMRRARAAELGVRSIADLAAHARSLTIGSDFEFFARPEWPALRDDYQLEFAARREFTPTFMYRALASSEADVITAFSSDGRIAADDLLVLDDPKQSLLPYDAVILISAKRANDALLLRALSPLIGAIDVEAMREANYRVDRDTDKASPAAAARWLEERAGLQAPN